MNLKRVILLSVSLIFLLQIPLFSQETEEMAAQTGSGLDFNFGLAIGAVNLIDEDGVESVYNSIRLNPDLAFGKFGIGLDLAFRFTMDTSNGDSGFRVYRPDWVIEDGTFGEYLNLYLGKFDYIRWGHSGDDLFAKIGSLDNATIGNGFIVGGYTNELFKPTTKYTGFRFELDTALFNWPYMGLELFASNISAFDLVAGRIYAKPLGGIKSPVFSGLEVGATLAMDRNPFYFLSDEDGNGYFDLADTGAPFEAYSELFDSDADPDTVFIYGLDVMQPLLDIKVFTMALYGDYVLQGFEAPSMGGTAGLTGTLVKFITWNGGLIFRGDDFVPSYFGRTYDLDRANRYILYTNDHEFPIQEAGIDYKASLGFSFMDGGISFVTQISGPFAEPVIADPLAAPWEYPHLMAMFTIGRDIIPYFDMSFWYDKQGIDEFAALVSAEHALIGGRINYRMDPAVISLQVDVKYDPMLSDSWDVTTKLETGIQF